MALANRPYELMALPLAERLVSMAEYPGLKQGHVIATVEGDGETIYLEDGACFKVYSGFLHLSNKWAAEHMMLIKANPKNPEHPYKLINVHFNEQVEARWLDDES